MAAEPGLIGADTAVCGAEGISPACRSAVRLLPLREGEPCGDAALHLRFDAAGSVAAHAAAAEDHDVAARAGQPGGHLLAIVDGLGHGGPAALAAHAALAVIEAQVHLPLPALFGALDTALAPTRGAAIGLARIEGRRLRYAGIGNTRALRWRGDRWLRLSSQYGIVGGGLPDRLDVTDVDLLPGDWLLLYTDGLDEMLHLPMHLPEWEREPALLCDHLLAHWRNLRDDAGVLALHVEEG